MDGEDNALYDSDHKREGRKERMEIVEKSETRNSHHSD